MTSVEMGLIVNVMIAFFITLKDQPRQEIIIRNRKDFLLKYPKTQICPVDMVVNVINTKLGNALMIILQI
jgi:hypothetical protein